MTDDERYFMMIDEIEQLKAENKQLQAQITAKETTLGGTYIDINTHFRDIEKLQSENSRLKAEIERLEDVEGGHLTSIDLLVKRLNQVETERDKAVGDLQGITKYNGTLTCHCNDMLRIANKWRGLEESDV